MCDTISGELLMSFHRSDPAAMLLLEQILNNTIPHVEVIESLADRLSLVNLPIRDNFDFAFYRLRVPPGEEEWKINYLQFFYKHALFNALSHNQMNKPVHQEILGRSDFHLQIVPHSVLWVSSNNTQTQPTITLSQTHAAYKSLLGWSMAYSSTLSKRVLILDTGLSLTTPITAVDKRNFVDPLNIHDITDDNGHGTMVTEIIHDLCPMADVLVYKVADKAGRASEWDTIAALAAKINTDVINISLAFGLSDTNCSVCGRESRSSRSAVFENVINQIVGLPNKPIIVAAAGNGSKNQLAYPARFGQVTAIASIDQSKHLSEFSNRSALNAEGSPHNSVFALPGGQKTSSNTVTEFVGSSSNGKKFYGTSFSAAYASGLIAALWSEPQHYYESSDMVLDYLRANADKSLPNYDPSVHGNGMMRLL